MTFGSQVSQDQVQNWIAQNPQFAQAVSQAMTAQPAVRYQPMAQNNQNWMGRNALPTTQTSVPGVVPQPVPGLHGRVVANPQDIRPNEIPMDGTASLFPMSDDSCIYAKAWGPDGMIQTIKYVPEKIEEEAKNEGPSEFSQVMTRLDKIEQMLGQRYQKQQYYNHNRNTQASNIHTVEGNTPKTEAMNNG